MCEVALICPPFCCAHCGQLRHSGTIQISGSNTIVDGLHFCMDTNCMELFAHAHELKEREKRFFASEIEERFGLMEI